jgi:hypothetical protein
LATAEQVLEVVTSATAGQVQAATATLATVAATEVTAAEASAAACQEVRLIAAPEVLAVVAAPVEEEDNKR